ncbi:hypothetical protein ABFX02_13G106800 [Erythranthe guttata]
MASRLSSRTLRRCLHSFKSLTSLSQTIARTPTHLHQIVVQKPANHRLGNHLTAFRDPSSFARNFSSKHTDSENDEEDDDDDETEDEDEDEDADYESQGEETGSNRQSVVMSEEEKLQEAAEIGYSVVGPLERSDRVFKPYEPVFAVVQIGSHQFKVCNRDSIYVERLKYCDINDKLVLNKVLMLGSETQTIIGRPILPDAAVHAVVEEHALDAKVIIFKKKRRKNYRRTKGHRQELTKLRITDIQGIEKPEPVTPLKKEKKEKKEKVAVEA